MWKLFVSDRNAWYHITVQAKSDFLFKDEVFKIVIIIIKHLQMNQISALNNA